MYSPYPIDRGSETAWGQPVTTQAMLDGMKAAGFDTLRIPVAWMTNATAMPFEMKDYTISEAYLARVREIVDYARNAGMYVILNDHWDGGWWGMFGSESKETAAFAMEAYQGMWKQIAEYFRDYSDYLIFESANEELGARFDENSPCYARDSVLSYLPDNERYALTNRVNQAFVDTVRATGGNNASRFLLIAGYGTNIDQTFDSRFQMPRDTAEKKLMVSVHYYDPWSYCGASSAAGATLWGKAADFDAMYKTLSKMSKFVSQGYGVVIGEYGALPAGDGVMKKERPRLSQGVSGLLRRPGFHRLPLGLQRLLCAEGTEDPGSGNGRRLRRAERGVRKRQGVCPNRRSGEKGNRRGDRRRPRRLAGERPGGDGGCLRGLDHVQRRKLVAELQRGRHVRSRFHLPRHRSNGRGNHRPG